MARLTYADFEKNAVRTMQLANQSAGQLNHDSISTEHILIGLCRNRPPVVTATLSHFRLTVEQILVELRSRVHPGPQTVGDVKRRPQASAMRVTEHAVDIASNLGATAVGNQHLMLGLLFVPGTSAAEVLAALGMRYDTVLGHIKET